MTEVKHQIYVSYADADEKWVVSFVGHLKDNLRQQLGKIDNDFIWAKYMPLGIGNKQDILQRHLSASKYLLVIASPAYFATIKNSEIDAFGKVDNLILVEYNKVELPENLQSLNSYQFWHEDDRGRALSYANPVATSSEPQYYRLLAEMARDIVYASNQSLQESIAPQYIVITVTDTEDMAFREVLKEQGIEVRFQKHEHLGYYNRFTVQDRHCALIRPIEKGRQASQSLVNKLLHYPPQLIIMSGICGGFDERGVKLNDVIFTNSVIDYERERLTDDKYRTQPQQYRASPRLLELIANFKTQLAQELRVRIHHEKILACGDKLLASRDHELRQKILGIHSDIYGIEMEGSGLFRAVYDAQTGRAVDVTLIKAVSDLGDEQMTKGKEQKQKKAAKIAAQVTLRVIEQY